ncbi:MAG: acyl-CoA reductase [Clostridia bacterium]|nr:acyl-CoA reductase [Clostridia bacterium]
MNQPKPYELLCGTDDFEQAAGLPVLQPFSESVLSFLSSVSTDLLKDQEARVYPDVAAFAYFCRRANLERLRQDYGTALSGRLGRGLTFHIAPSNVPINFAYSLVSSLLAGNPCIVKASSLDFPQTRIVCRALRSACLRMTDRFPTKERRREISLHPYVNVLIYPRNRQDITERLSALCAIRLVWGGDETIRRVRQAPLAPQSFDVTFADRYSLLVIRASAIERMDEKALAALAHGFYNDAFVTDQNACSSPRLVYWVVEGQAAKGADARSPRERFWEAIHAYAAPRYPIQPVAAVDKLTALYRARVKAPDLLPMTVDAACLSWAGEADAKTMVSDTSPHHADNLITRVQVEALSPLVEELRCGGGFFVEYENRDLEALAPIVRRNYQTLSYAGFDPQELRDWVTGHGLSGIDRIVPVGHAMDFSLVWDGTDLIRTLSRAIETR